MKNLLISVLALACCLCLGCSGVMEESPMPASARHLYYETDVYFSGDNGYLIPAEKKLDWSNDMALNAVKCLVTGYESEAALAEAGLKAPFPFGTDFEFALTGGTAYLNVLLLEALPEDELKSALNSASATLLSFPGISEVALSINGSKLYGELDFSENISSFSVNSLSEGEGSEFELSYLNSSGMIVPVVKNLQETDPKEIFTALKNAPEGLKPLFPADAELLSFIAEEDTLFLDIEGSFGNYSPADINKILGSAAQPFLQSVEDGINKVAFIWRGEILHSAELGDSYKNEIPHLSLSDGAY